MTCRTGLLRWITTPPPPQQQLSKVYLSGQQRIDFDTGSIGEHHILLKVRSR
jgi:hypothetical protein